MLSDRALADENMRRDAFVPAVPNYCPRYNLVLEVNRTGDLPELLRRADWWIGAGAFDVPTLEEAFALGRDSWFALEASVRDALYGLGWVLVSAAGYEEVLEAAAHGGVVTPEAFFELAGIDPDDPASLQRVFLDFMGEASNSGRWPQITLRSED